MAENLLNEIDGLWSKNGGFKEKQRSWIGQIRKTQLQAEEAKQYFHQWQPLSAYVRAGSSGSFNFSLRFYGQEVGALVVKGPQEVDLKITEKIAQTNKRFLTMPEGLYKWRSKEAQNFRKAFQTLARENEIKVHSPEHRVESRIIKEMFSNKRSKFGGTFAGIQPVTLSGFPLQFPLPISASSGKPKASNGHIDILARRRAGQVSLSVWELKAPQCYKNTLREVYIYSVTLLKMLRDPEFGQEWYRIFGFSGKLPKTLRVEGVVAITRDREGQLNKELADHVLPLNIGNDRLALFAAYYDETTLALKFEKLCS